MKMWFVSKKDVGFVPGEDLQNSELARRIDGLCAVIYV
jgi:hypothetical protein